MPSSSNFSPTFLFVVGAVTVLYIQNHVLGAALGLWAVLFIAFDCMWRSCADLCGRSAPKRTRG